MKRNLNNGPNLTDVEIERMFTGYWARRFPPILNVEQAAALADVPKKTIYDWSSRRLLNDCAHRSGRRLRILRLRFMRFLFENKD